MKKSNLTINSKPEEIIIASSVAVALAILFDGKNNKKKNKGFFKRTAKNYKIVDRFISTYMTYKITHGEKNFQKPINNEKFKTKIKNLKIENSIPFDLEE